MQAIEKLCVNAEIKLGTDVIIHDANSYKRVITNGSLGLGESYMEGWWDAPHLDQVFAKIGRANISNKNISWYLKLWLIYVFVSNFIGLWLSKIFNGEIARSKRVAVMHYDLNNEFYTKMLDSKMIYSCAYWRNAEDLETAQSAKCELICQKLKLIPDMTVLDIGCGWGGLAKYMSSKYKVKVLGITNSKEQYEYACKNNAYSYGNQKFSDYMLMDYRQLPQLNVTFDAVVSVGMFEHVSSDN